jgi:DNA topoisomerase-3
MGDDIVKLFQSIFTKLSPVYEISKLSKQNLISADNKHIFNSKALEAHHALIPLDVLPAQASDMEKKVFEIVVNSFFRVCMGDFVYNEKTVVFSVKDFKFVSRLREVLDGGFKKSIKETKETKDDDDLTQEVAAFDEKNCHVERAATLSKETKPPKEFTISTLLAFMENPRGDDGHRLIGLGTSATRGEVIKNLSEKKYITQEKGKKLLVTREGAFVGTR